MLWLWKIELFPSFSRDDSCKLTHFKILLVKHKNLIFDFEFACIRPIFSSLVKCCLKPLWKDVLIFDTLSKCILANERGNEARHLWMGDGLRQSGSACRYIKVTRSYAAYIRHCNLSSHPPSSLLLPSSDIPLHPLPLQFQLQTFLSLQSAHFSLLSDHQFPVSISCSLS